MESLGYSELFKSGTAEVSLVEKSRVVASRHKHALWGQQALSAVSAPWASLLLSLLSRLCYFHPK